MARMQTGAAGISPALVYFPPLVPSYVPAVTGIPEQMAQAISEHWSAWVNFQIVTTLPAALRAEDEEAEALMRLLATPAENPAGVRALAAHLAWYAVEEAQRYKGRGGLDDLPFIYLKNLQVALTGGAV